MHFKFFAENSWGYMKFEMVFVLIFIQLSSLISLEMDKRIHSLQKIMIKSPWNEYLQILLPWYSIISHMLLFIVWKKHNSLPRKNSKSWYELVEFKSFFSDFFWRKGLSLKLKENEEFWGEYPELWLEERSLDMYWNRYFQMSQWLGLEGLNCLKKVTPDFTSPPFKQCKYILLFIQWN